MSSNTGLAIASNASIAATDPLEQLRQDRDSALDGTLRGESGLPGPRDVPVAALPAFEPIISDTGPVDPSVTPEELPAFEPIVSDTGPVDPNVTPQELPAFEPIVSDTGPVDPNVTPQELPAFEPVISETGPLDPGDLLASVNEDLSWFLAGPEPAAKSDIEPNTTPPSDHVVGGVGSLESAYSITWNDVALADLPTVDHTI